MARMPRLLPLVAVAIGGVLAVNAVRGGPGLMGAAQALAEDAAGKPGPKPALEPTASISAAPKPAAPVCAPTASELAKEAGLSPAELQVLQSLGTRRGELDQREQGLDTQVQLIAAAETKLDQRIKEMNGLKTDIQGLLGQVDAQQQSEIDRLIVVYEKMKPKDAAARITLMDDRVRLPMAAKMKPAKLADILAQMPAEDAKNLTEKLSHRMSGDKSVADARTALNPPAAPAAPPPTATAKNDKAAPAVAAPADPAAPKPKAVAKAKPRAKRKAPKTALAAADKAAPQPVAASGKVAPADKPAAGAAPAATAPAKSG